MSGYGHEYLNYDECHFKPQEQSKIVVFTWKDYKQKEAMLDKQVIHLGSSSELYLIGTQINFRISFSYSLMWYITSLSM